MTTATGPSGPFRIHVVAEMTGIPEPTLRAWERRYGIPTPERTAAGYRLYGLREVEQVRAMKAACEAGMSAAEAAESVRASGGVAPRGVAVATDPFSEARKLLLDAVSRLDDEALESRLRQVMFLGNATTILDEVLAPTMIEIGRRWHDGRISVAHEHFASFRIATALRDLARLSSAPVGAPAVLLAGFADDDHELGFLGLAVRLGTWGFRPIVLGARTPPAGLHEAVASIHPALVGLSVTVTPEPARARELVEAYALACAGTPWLVGGSGAPGLERLVRAQGGLVAPGDAAALRTLVEGALSPAKPPRKERK